MFSIIIPTFNNLKYLKFCIQSLKKNSKYDHEIIPHINVGNDGTSEYLKSISLKFTHTLNNVGICKGMNLAAEKSSKEYILYSHDDFYFTPDWDKILKQEIDLIGHNKFYLSGTMMHKGQIDFDCGQTIEEFDENRFLRDYKKFNFYDFQGTTWAPHLIHRDLWNKVGGLSEEFFPGMGSDPDLNMKLWKEGVRIFKGINNFKVYHFGSIVLRDKINHIKPTNKYGSNSAKIFLLKWGITIKFFKKFILKSNTKYTGELKSPNKSFKYFLYYVLCKINYLYVKFIYNINNKIKLPN